MQLQESFAICSDTDITDWLLDMDITARSIDRDFVAEEMKQTFKIAHSTENIIMSTRLMCHAIRQCDWLEAQICAKVVLKCITAEPGELCVVNTLIRRRQQELRVTCLDTDMSDSYLVTAMVPVVDRFGWTTFSAKELKRTLQIVDITAGVITTANTDNMSQFHVQ